MKNYIVSLSKRVLLLSGALAIFAACDDGDLGDIYKGNSSGEYVSDVNWTDAADKSTGTNPDPAHPRSLGRPASRPPRNPHGPPCQWLRQRSE